MTIQLVWPGRTKEPYAREAVDKYMKQIKPFCDLDILEIKEARGQDRTGALEKEGKLILRTVKDFVLLHDSGPEMSSPAFAELLGKKQKWSFVIGGPYGVSREVHNAAGGSLSLSQMTFPHDLARIMLLEQIYRGLTILNKRGYHH